MLADLFRSIAATFTNPAEELWYKVFMAVVLLLFAGLGWMLLRRGLRLAWTPFEWWRERRAWSTVAATAGWTTPATRKFAGKQDGRDWRMRTHVQGAWISDVDANVEGNPASQAQWRMRNLTAPGHLVLMHRSVDDELCKQAQASAGMGEAADVALAAAGLAGLLLGQAWAGGALNLSGSFGSDAGKGPSLAVVSAGSEEFRKRFVVRSDNAELARHLITPDVEAMISAMHDEADPANPFSAQYAEGTLTLCHLGNFSQAVRAERLCRLGLAMANASAQAATPV